uniref:Candidate secreted effector n=1 Tax=Meloidogyne incognita TaxID=6306 RepID=A0A914M894_MELIC
MIVLIGSVNGDHCSILKLNCEKYCHETCGYESGDTVVCKIIKSICDYIGCCQHEDD